VVKDEKLLFQFYLFVLKGTFRNQTTQSKATTIHKACAVDGGGKLFSCLFFIS
jgi:hypothetical protein